MCKTPSNNYGIAWKHYDSAKNKSYIYFKATNKDLIEFVKPKKICEISNETNYLTIAPLTDHLFMIMWCEPDFEKESYRLYYSFSNRENKYSIETGDGNAFFPTSSYLDGKTLFIYQSNNEGFYKLYCGSFVPTGELIRLEKLARPIGEARNASLVGNPELKEFMLVWQDSRDGELRFLPQWQIYFSRLNTDGSIERT